MGGEFLFGKTFGSWITPCVMIQDGTSTWSFVRLRLELLRVNGWTSIEWTPIWLNSVSAWTQFFLNQNEDELIWKNDPSGVFSIGSAYDDSFDDYEEPCWAKAWVKGMKPKVNIFFLIHLQNKFLTLDNLKKRGIIIINRCVLCKNDGESVEHITLHCPFTKKIWDKICSLLNAEWVFPSTI